MNVDSVKLVPMVFFAFLGGAQLNTAGAPGAAPAPLQSTGSQKICTFLISLPTSTAQKDISFVSVPAPASWTTETCKAYAKFQSTYTSHYHLACLFDTPTAPQAYSIGSVVPIAQTAPAPSSNCGW